MRYRPGPTAADALAAPFFGSLNFDIVRERVREVVTVTEPEIADGVRWCYQRAKLAVEPGAAVPIAALLARRVSVQPGQRVGVLVSGANPDPAVIAPMLMGEETSRFQGRGLGGNVLVSRGGWSAAIRMLTRYVHHTWGCVRVVA